MRLVDFAEQRGVPSNTIHMYLKRHQAEFEGHIDRSGKNIEIDDVAFNLLDAQYPSPDSLVNVVPDPKTQEENIRLLNRNSELLEMILRLKDEISSNAQLVADAKYYANMIEQKDDKIAEMKAKCQDLEGQLQEQIDQADLASEKAREETARADNAEKQLDEIAKAGFWERRKMLRRLKQHS